MNGFIFEPLTKLFFLKNQPYGAFDQQMVVAQTFELPGEVTRYWLVGSKKAACRITPASRFFVVETAF